MGEPMVPPLAPSFAAADQEPERGSRRAKPGSAVEGRGQGNAVNHGQLLIRQLKREHWPGVKAIYEQGIAGGNATFETEAPSWEDWDKTHLEGHRLVALQGGEVVGWAALAPVSERCVYAGVAENSVYVADSAQGRGVGRALLDELIRRSEQDGIWTIQTGIFPENVASLELHKRCGFRVVGTRERIGLHHDVWRDVVFMERRARDQG
jgi:L-amino acid N-acyltransferase YncA